MADPPALLVIAASEHDSNLYYATRFLAPDPFVFLQAENRKILLMTDLEIDRARSEAMVDKGGGPQGGGEMEIRSLTAYEEKARQRSQSPHLIDSVSLFLEECGVQEVAVPSNFPLEHADRLREKGVRVSAKPDPFFPSRLVKTGEEIAAIAETQRHTEAAMEAALSVLRESEVKGEYVHWRGKILTAEDLKKVISLSLMENDCIARNTIVACGAEGVDPHNRGSGPVRANESIVFDIFPRSNRTRYCADMTRTVVKGEASDGLKRMYEAVLAAQERGIELIRDGASGQAIHGEVARVMESRGFETGVVEGRNQGFFHGTGHGVGLDIHEPPRIGKKVDETLRAGQVVTVEPGLYYPRWGAVRIEDLVVVRTGGCLNLANFPKFLEI
jgi:Xaa-Pro aminopeptidase